MGNLEVTPTPNEIYSSATSNYLYIVGKGRPHDHLKLRESVRAKLQNGASKTVLHRVGSRSEPIHTSHRQLKCGGPRTNQEDPQLFVSRETTCSMAL